MENPEVDGTEQIDQFDGADHSDATGPENNSAGGFNPAWEPIKEKLGDAAFQLIQPELSQWDQGVNKRFETISSQYAPYKDLGTPEELAKRDRREDSLLPPAFRPRGAGRPTKRDRRALDQWE
jgi:hypothetical protein